MSENNKLKLPSVLAFERKLEVSDGLMYAGNWENKGKETEEKDKKKIKLWHPIPITPRKNRSTQSAYGIKDTKKTEANPVASGDDQAVIPKDCNTLRVSWTLRVIGRIGLPFTCNNPVFEKAIQEKTKDFDFSELSYRYAYNIANGRFLWRNRVCAENVEIHVLIKDSDQPLIFNAYDFSLQNFDDNNDNESLNTLAEVIKKGLADKTGENLSSIKVDAFVKLDELQQIFPSQEMNMNEKGKTLFALNECAALHNVKIGNAIRTIDNWYGNTAIVLKDDGKTVEDMSISENQRVPIAIEPYGSVTQRGIAYRPKTNDLYTLMKDWLNDKDITDDDKNYVIANLIRGGLFQAESKKAKNG